MRILLLSLCVVMSMGCAKDDPLPIMSPEGVKDGFVAEATASARHAGSIPATSTTVTTTTTSTTTTTTTTTTVVPKPVRFDDAPEQILSAIQSLWPEDQWSRAQSVAWCESRYQIDAANPESSARGVFQILAPWTRNPGSGRTVWGWDYTEDGEKLSAAASLGISQDDARYTIANITVAHKIWQHEGWGPWAASQFCWAE